MDILFEKAGRGTTQVNIIVVPGIHAERLIDQTCPHFEEDFVKELLKHQHGPTTVRLFRHDLRFEDLKAWEMYCYMGEKLLDQMKELVTHGLHDPGKDSFLLLGHKLGVFILKTALILADQRRERPILDSIDLLMLLGDPQLTPDNRSEWTKLIELCCCSQKIPKQLSVEKNVECLQEISERFDRITFHSSLLELGIKSRDTQRKRERVWRRRHQGGKCIRYPEITMTKDTTQGDPDILEPQDGDKTICAFSNSSAHFRNLIEASDTTVFASIHPRCSLQHLLAKQPDAAEDNIIIEAATGKHMSRMMEWDSYVDTWSTDRSTEECDVQALRITDDSCRARNAMNRLPLSGMADALPSSDTPPVVSSEADVGSNGVDSETQDTWSSISTGEMLTDIQAQSSSDSLVQQSDIFNMPFTLLRPAIGREKLIAHMRDFFGRSTNLASSSWLTKTLSACGRTVLLQGVPGIGKTCAALSYCFSSRADYDLVARIRADSLLTIGQDYRSLAVNLGIVSKTSRQSHAQSQVLVEKWLDETDLRWLLVFDDCNEDAILNRCLMSRRASSRGDCIITTRVEGSIECLSDMKDILVLQVERLDVDASLKMLSTLAPNAVDELDASHMKSLVRHCEGIPLALEVVAQLASRRGLTYSEVDRILHYQGKGSNLATKQWQIANLASPSVSLARIQEAVQASLSASASAVLAVVAFCDPDSIDESLLWSEALSGNTRLRFYPKSRAEFLSARSELWHHSAFEVYTESTLSRFWQHSYWHRSWVFQEIVVSSLDDATFVDSFHTAATTVFSQWPSIRKLSNIARGHWPEFNILHRHTHNMCRHISWATGLGVPAKAAWALRRPIALPELLSGPFLQLLQLSLWYNSILGNRDEDEDLHLLLQDVARLLKSSTEYSNVPPAYATVSTERARSRLQREHFQSMARHCTGRWFHLSSLPPRPSTLSSRACVPQRLVDITDLGHCRVLRRPSSADSCPTFIAILIDDRQLLDQAKMDEPYDIVVSGDHFAVSRLPTLQRQLLISTRLSGIRYVWVNTFCMVQRNDYTPLEACTSVVYCKPKRSARRHVARVIVSQTNPSPNSPLAETHAREMNPFPVPSAIDTEKDLVISQHAMKMGIEAALSNNFVLACAQLSKARDVVSMFQIPRTCYIEVTIHATIYLIHIYCQTAFLDLAQDALDRLSHVIKIQSDAFQHGSIQMGQLALVRGRIQQEAMKHGGPAGEATAQYKEALTIFQPCAPNDILAGDFLALSQVKLAEVYLASSGHQLAHSYIQPAIAHWQGRVGKLEETADEHYVNSPESPHASQHASQPNEQRIDGGIDTLDAVQAQLGRALMVQALIYEAELKTRLARSAFAAARATVQDLEERRSMQTPETGLETNIHNAQKHVNVYDLQDFTAAIKEFWLR